MFALKKKDESGYTATTSEKVTSIIFSVWSPQQIISGSVCEVTSPDTYENNVPKPGGLFDRRMGVIENGQVCETCKQNNHNCTGHFGHIMLAKPVYYIQLMTMVITVLKCVCWRCSKCLLTEDDKKDLLKTSSKARLKAVTAKLQAKSNSATKAHHCPFCDAIQPKYSNLRHDKGQAKISYSQKKEGGGGVGKEKAAQTKLPIENVLLILKRITDEDVLLIGLSPKYSRPDWMICRALPVSPPHVRPSVRQDGNQKAEDDLTHKMCDIVKTNNSLKQALSAEDASQQVDTYHMCLQYHVATLMDNETLASPAIQRGSGRPLKSLGERLKAKDGRMRGNLMGKRCNFTARSVISPDANIALDELGVPLTIAKNLTFPVTVTDLNLAELQACVGRKDVHPGAKSVVKASSGRRYCLAFAPTEVKLELGDVVNRHMIDGDIVLFNRQPSLHKMSMMGHRVRVLPGETFRLNLSVTTPYNADFDGDEMNGHSPQCYQTLAELKHLTLVPSQIITAQKNAPVMGIVQDSLLGANLMTRLDTKPLSKLDACRLLMWNNEFAGVLPPPSVAAAAAAAPTWTGKQLFAAVLPPIINLTRRGAVFQSGHHMVGTGALDKSILGNAAGGLIHIIYKDYGEQQAADFIYKTQQLANNWLLLNGFSVGIADCCVPRGTVSVLPNTLDLVDTPPTANLTNLMTIENFITEQIAQTQKRVAQKLERGYKKTSGNEEQLDVAIKLILNSGRDKIAKVITNGIGENRLVDMIKAESKGSPINVMQISGILGQSEVEGKRAPLNLIGRVLPFYARDDDTAEARGFIATSFLQGLSPQAYVFHALAGRIGIIDSAVKTAETGYIQRRLIKTMEDVRVWADHTVRNATGNIVEFQYGEDGYDACRLEAVMIDFHTVSTEVFNDRYVHHHIDDMAYWNAYLTDAAAHPLDASVLEEELAAVQARRTAFQAKIVLFEDKVYAPAHVVRIIDNVRAKHQITRATFSNLSPIVTYELVQEQIKRMKTFITTTPASVSITIARAEHTLYVLETLLLTLLHSKQVLVHLNLTQSALKEVLREVHKMFLRGLANPGEMVGIIASQSIGEPATQMTLNTFHMSGVSAKSQTTTGVPRLKELLNVSKTPKTPSLRVFLHPMFAVQATYAAQVGSSLILTTVKDITLSGLIKLHKANSNPPPLSPVLNTAESVEQQVLNDDKSTYLLIRLMLDKRVLNERNIEMDVIQKKIDFAIKKEFKGKKDKDKDNVNVLVSDISTDWCMCLVKFSAKAADVAFVRDIYKRLGSIAVCGVPGITNVWTDECLSKSQRYATKDDGSFSKVAEKEYILGTVGSNLADALIHPHVDAYRTVSNNVNEIYALFGIEAARQALIEEFTSTLETTSYVNYRHICLLADVMTNKGFLLSIDIHGVKKGDIGPLARASFEETVDQLVKSACFAETDKMSGVSANIMLGQVPPTGTGTVQLLFDECKMERVLKALAASAPQPPPPASTEYFDNFVTTCYTEKPSLTSCADSFASTFVPLGTSSVIITKTKTKLIIV